MALPDSQKKAAYIGGTIVLGVLLVYLSLHLFSSTPGKAPSNVTFVCQNPACRDEFTMTAAEIAKQRAAHPDEPIHCPKCGGTDVIQKGARPNRTVSPMNATGVPAPR